MSQPQTTANQHLSEVEAALAAKDAKIERLQHRLARLRAAGSAKDWAVITELARIAQTASSTTETTSDAWRAGRQHVLDLIERRLAELRRPKGDADG